MAELTARICKICGKEFIPTHFNQKICTRDHYHKCPECGKSVKTTNFYHLQCCSKECIRKHTEKTNLAKYGATSPAGNPDILEKIQITNQERYGHRFLSQNPELHKKQVQTYLDRYGKSENPKGYQKLQEHRISTNQSRYGVDHVFQSDTFKQNSKISSLSRYGVDNPFKSDIVRKKAEQTCINRYGAPNSFQSKSIRNKIQQTNLDRYGVPWYCMTDECKEASGHIISKINLKFSEFLDKHHVDYDFEYRIGTYSYDFKINDMLIEIDPTFTHNSYINMFDRKSDGIDSEYHLKKSKVAFDNNYRCIHIFDWDDWDKLLNIFVSPKYHIGARSCKVLYIDNKTASVFETKHHIQSACKGQTVCIGLYYKNELVQVMTFGKPRYTKQYEWELLRLCTNSQYRVVGGASRLFKHFILDYSPKSIISYCDRAKFRGGVYKQIGMILDDTTSPAKIWSKGNDYITDNLLRQRGFDQLFDANFGKGTSNEKLMIENDWLPVYDCGQYKYIWR